MKAKLISDKTDLFEFIKESIFNRGHIVFVSDKQSSNIYSRITDVSDSNNVYTASFELLSVSDIEDVILFEYEEEDRPWDIRELLKLIKKTNKDYDKLECIERHTKLNLLMDCEGVPYQITEDDYDIDVLEPLLRNLQLVTWNRIKDKDIYYG